VSSHKRKRPHCGSLETAALVCEQAQPSRSLASISVLTSKRLCSLPHCRVHTELPACIAGDPPWFRRRIDGQPQAGLSRASARHKCHGDLQRILTLHPRTMQDSSSPSDAIAAIRQGSSQMLGVTLAGWLVLEQVRAPAR